MLGRFLRRNCSAHCHAGVIAEAGSLIGRFGGVYFAWGLMFVGMGVFCSKVTQETDDRDLNENETEWSGAHAVFILTDYVCVCVCV